jgi:acetyltransferase-like isoleucine patch superfamily enzyme
VASFQRNGRGYLNSWCKPCKYAQQRQRERNPQVAARIRALGYERRLRVRAEVLRKYGDGRAVCVCCGESRDEFLSVDHINGGGRAHRASFKGTSIYAWLTRNGFPAGYQILCMNCNFAKGHRMQRCPHEEDRRPGVMISPRALVDQSVVIGKGSAVWDGAKIMGGSVLGEYVSIGGYTEIGRSVAIGESTRIGYGCFLPNRTQVGDRVFIAPRAVLCDDKHPRVNHPGYRAEPPVIEADASIGAGAVILPGVRIGRGAVVGAGAVVTRDVEAYQTVIGNPARLYVRQEEGAE